jgi:tRNA(Ile)-lysidine synthetase-like protein
MSASRGAIELRPYPAPGAWAVGVSGGADSVALLLLLSQRSDLSLHIVHLDHQLRGEASAGDAEFVRELAEERGLPCTIARREEWEAKVWDLPANPSARWRALRMELFSNVVTKGKLAGVALAHHADDQAETILMRVLRGKGPTRAGGLGGMTEVSRWRGTTVIRPLLHVRRQALRDLLCDAGQAWREDESNQSDRYTRNLVRGFLLDRPELHEPVLELGRACGDYARWVRENSPRLEASFFCKTLARLPGALARESARRWLVGRGAPSEGVTPGVVGRLIEMAVDAASPGRGQFPGGVVVRRAGGRISRAG